MEDRLLKIGWILMLIVGIQRALVNIMMIAMGEGSLDSNILYAVHVVAILFVTMGAFKKGEKWSWWCLLIVGITPPLYCSIVHGLNVWVIVSWVLFLPAIIIPAKSILARKSG